MRVLVNIDVPDLERAKRFYCDAFGLTASRNLAGVAIELVGADATIYLLAAAAGSRATHAEGVDATRTYARHWTPVHLDFVVDDVDAAVDRAVAAGARLEKPAKSHAWGRIATLADPFGHGLCLLQFLGRGYDEIALSPR